MHQQKDEGSYNEDQNNPNEHSPENEHSPDHVDYHIIRDDYDQAQPPQSPAGVTAYAAIKYISIIIITIIVLFFIANFVLPFVRDLVR